MVVSTVEGKRGVKLWPGRLWKSKFRIAWPRKQEKYAIPLKTKRQEKGGMGHCPSHAEHLIVLQHGLHGSQRDWKYFEQVLHVGNESNGRVYCHVATSNDGSRVKTHDGIELGGRRLVREIVELTKSMPMIKYFSIIGHSLGGLYARYAVAVLYDQGYFTNVKPLNFITLATPHLGVRRPNRGSVNKIINTVTPRLFSATGSQMTLTDRVLDIETLRLALVTGSHSRANLLPNTNVENISISSLRNNAVHRDEPLTPAIRSGNEYNSIDMQGILRVTMGETLSVQYLGILRNGIFSLYKKSCNEPPAFSMQAADVRVRVIIKCEESIQCQLFDLNDKSPLEIHFNGDLSVALAWITRFNISGMSLESIEEIAALKNTRRVKQSEPDMLILLDCMTKGCFLESLRAFRMKALYSNVFYDMQVPYTSAGIRSHNPYRGDPTGYPTSAIYPHVTLQSISSNNAIPRRNTASQIKRLVRCAKSNTNRFGILKHVPFLYTNLGDNRGCRRSSIGPRTRANTSADKKCDPFRLGTKSGEILVDHFEEAFQTDLKRNQLRSMLFRLQSLAWQRFDVVLEGPLAHERIIGKGALSFRPSNNGLDIACHLSDIFIYC